MRRHETLRTTFPQQGGQPVQRIAPPGPATLPVIDLSGLSEQQREAEAAERVRWAAGRPFELEAGPLVRASLLRLGAEEWVALLTLHHIVSDGWSMGVLVDELAALYAGGGRSPLPELPIQYADYAVWQRGWLTGEVLEAQLAYWQGRLAGVPAVLDLPTDRPRPAVQSLAGGEHAVALSAGLSRQLAALSRQEGGTLFMTLLAGFQALLYRYSGQEDLLVGSPVANRTRGETERLIGLFVNTLVLRGRPAGERTFRELLAEAREASLDAYAHQDLPFERLVEELRPERDLSRPPLFQVMLVHQNAPLGKLALPGLTLHPVDRASGTSKFELNLAVRERGEGEARRLAGSLEYSAALFDPATAQRLLGHFETLLRGVVEEPETRLGDLPLLAEIERRQLLEWNDSEPPVVAACLHELFAAQAAETPGATALVFGTERLTYAELDARADRWARRLAWLGVGPEVPVGICAERTPEMVVGLLAVLKAGGAYVPLDPNYPAQRLAWILEDIHPRKAGPEPPIVLTQERLLAKLEGIAARPVCLDQAWEGEEAEPRPAGLGNLAYVIYTSGLDRTAEGSGDRAPHGRGAGALVARGVLGSGDGGRARRDVDQLRHVGVRAVGDARPGRQADPGGQRSGAAVAVGEGGGDAGQHRAVGHRRAGAQRRAAALGAYGQPGRRAALAVPGGRHLRGAGRSSGCSTSMALPRTRPSRASSACRGRSVRRRSAGRSPAPKARCSTGACGRRPWGCRASCTWAAPGSPAATSAGRT